tara:strand:- start:6735 stop:7037 length:303 start_codon:yes stop_codon:yes gene_type:complete
LLNILLVIKKAVYLYHNLKQKKMTNTNTYFWAHEYRHYMRSLRTSLQNEVLRAFIDFDLEPTGVSDLHEQLICEIIGDYTIKGENPNNRLKRLKYAYPNG